MARTLLWFRPSAFEGGARFGFSRLQAGAALAFFCGVGAGLLHARLVGLL